jgi:thymidylate synthase (FAD)
VEHFSVLRQAFIKFKCYGFPHSTMSQIARHHETAPLVTSMRYTGKKFIKVSQGLIPCDRAFYVRSPGTYSDRTGCLVDWTEQDRIIELTYAETACDRYTHYVENRGMPMEMAREFLPFCYRQPFVIAGTIGAFFHWVDQRSQKNSEREIQILAQLAMDEFAKVAPEFHAWYMDKRWSKARLAP